MSPNRPFVVNILDDLSALNTSLKFDLICKIWSSVGLSLSTFRESEYTAFFAHLSREVSYLKHNHSELAADGVEQAIDLICTLKENMSEPRYDILLKFREQFPNVDDHSLNRTIELVARLWLTAKAALDVGVPATMHTNYGTLEWPTEVSLKEAVQSHFSDVDATDIRDESLGPGLDPSFTASTLVEICGIKLSWTSNLMDHLRLDKRHRVLTVYEHKICLLNHTKGIDSPLPLDLLHETIDTLNLLFPFGHGPTRELLRRENKLALYGLGTCNRTRRLGIGDYRIWRTQITSLVDVFNEPPRNWWQLLSDRRDLREWTTLWLGLMVLVLTIVSIVTGTVSSVYAVKQYNLARAQACAACAM
ncbi:hypothetical protein P171DRAFT_526926 [Karstenula rhodostoma CBS 690.94]|uniref:Uncharacterized protein n=1 Tax=Karstenula rhodostoma CBS 690.94 TaxID=1392251 RepID=A0A9P4U3Y2_9PLEO|nr:hypothetical protein P171DRAFT_526926 [Karstenula rhodostoma CBS 690.94]